MISESIFRSFEPPTPFAFTINLTPFYALSVYSIAVHVDVETELFFIATVFWDIIQFGFDSFDFDLAVTHFQFLTTQSSAHSIGFGDP